MLRQGLEQTAGMWPQIRLSYGWVHRAVQLLGNQEGHSVYELRRAYRGLPGEMSAKCQGAGSLSGAISHFLKVTRSYWPGLFYCYEHPDIPRTNNDLEHCFGSARYHERRCTGRKMASPAMVVRGRVRLVAAVATRAHSVSAEELIPKDLAGWRGLRAELEHRHEARREQLRFRRDPDL